MLFKVWLSNGKFDFSEMFIAENVEQALKIAEALALKYSAQVKSVDNVYFGKFFEKLKEGASVNDKRRR